MTRPKSLIIPGQDEQIADRRRQVWEKTLQWKSPTVISRELGIPRNTVYKDKLAVLQEVEASTQENAKAYREELTSKLEAILERWGPLATADELIVEGEKIKNNGEREIISLESYDAGLKAATVVLNTIREIAKLQGAYLTQDEGPVAGKAKGGLHLTVNMMQAAQGAAASRELPVIDAEILQ